jgi:cytochrome c-type biogenesis protein
MIAGTVVLNGPSALALAFAAGIVSFLSPCTLPLLPGYLSYISGLGVEEVRSGENTSLLLGASALFVLGFSLVFVALGATASYIGSLVLPYHTTLTRVAGIFIIFMALAMLGVLRIPYLYREKRFSLGREFGVWSAFPLGMAFAFGWAPCIGPVLASILGFATTEHDAQKGAVLLFVYALGLGLPFLGAALFAGRALGSLTWFKRHFVAVNRAGGAILLVMGVFLVMNRWTQLLSPLLRWYADHGPQI